MGLRVVGLGQSAVGDDGAGIAVIEALRSLAPHRCFVARDASGLLPLLCTPDEVVLVDAVLADPPGEVRRFDLDALEGGPPAGVSSHGLGVRQAVELARITEPERLSPCIAFVGITIARPQRYHEGLSPEVALAVSRVVDELSARLR